MRNNLSNRHFNWENMQVTNLINNEPRALRDK